MLKNLDKGSEKRTVTVNYIKILCVTQQCVTAHLCRGQQYIARRSTCKVPDNAMKQKISFAHGII